MPADFAINTVHRFVFSIGWDVLNVADILDHRTRLTGDPQFCVDFNQIIDITQVTGEQLSHDAIWSLAKQRLFAPESRRALVTSSNVQFGLSRIFQTYSESQHVRVFRGRNEAAEWIGVPLEAVEQAFSALASQHGFA